jgi:lipopolysaccharide transport system ATP-binding protein
MSETAIRVCNLSKRYQIGAPQQRYQTLRDSIASGLAAPWRRLRSIGRPRSASEESTLWALRDLDFEVKAGEVVGIIGRNGAGKSTLLKVLSRITEPTSGYAEIRGRIGSLLEVGTGFHNELTGRENIFLNGAILGMKQAEIRRQFDAIVAFSEVDRFIDTPVKFYSSGMYLRLAFAVAAHLEPETLLIDEVLAVGDLAFQKKCLGKMGEVAQQGRTILFVSHNMGAVRSLCTRGVVLDGGRLLYQGDIGAAIETYYNVTAASAATPEESAPKSGFGFGPVRAGDCESRTVDQKEGFEVHTVLHLAQPICGFTLLCQMEDMHQRGVFHLRRESGEFGPEKEWQGSYQLRVKIPALWLEPGMYGVYFKILLRGNLANSRYVSEVLHLDFAGESSGWGALLTPSTEWSLKAQSADSAQAAESVAVSVAVSR